MINFLVKKRGGAGGGSLAPGQYHSRSSMCAMRCARNFNFTSAPRAHSAGRHFSFALRHILRFVSSSDPPRAREEGERIEKRGIWQRGKVGTVIRILEIAIFALRGWRSEMGFVLLTLSYCGCVDNLCPSFPLLPPPGISTVDPFSPSSPHFQIQSTTP